MTADLTMTPFQILRGKRVSVVIQISGGEWAYTGVIVDTTPREKPWRKFLVKPVTEHPHVFAKWVEPRRILGMIGGETC